MHKQAPADRNEDERLKREPPPWGPPKSIPRETAPQGDQCLRQSREAPENLTAEALNGARPTARVEIFPLPLRRAATAAAHSDPGETGALPDDAHEASRARDELTPPLADWAGIRQAYETSSIPRHRIAVNWGVPYAALLRRSVMEGWQRPWRRPETGSAGEACRQAREAQRDEETVEEADEGETALDRASVEEAQKRELAQFRRLIGRLMDRLKAFLEGKLDRRFILGRNESLSSCLLKLGRALERNIKMERIVHRLNEDQQPAEADSPVLRDALEIMTDEEKEVFAAVARRLEEHHRSKLANDTDRSATSVAPER